MYGLMYDPFLIKKQSNYKEIYESAGDETKNKMTYQYKVIKSRFIDNADGGWTSYSIGNEGDTVVAEDEDIFTLLRVEGFCPVCTSGRDTFTETTRKIAGCINHVSCHHGNIGHISSGEDDERRDVFWYMEREKGYCDNANAEFKCDHECGESCEGESGCIHEGKCLTEDIGCAGYYTGEDGHDHYALWSNTCLLFWTYYN